MAEVPRIDQQRPATLGEGTPAPDDPRKLQRQRGKAQWDLMNTPEKVRAVAQAGVRSIPLAGKPLHHSIFGQNETAINAARSGAPRSTFVSEAAGSGLPYMVGGPLSMTGRAAAGATLGAADSYMEGEDPIVGGIFGGATAGAGHVIPGTITPRPRLRQYRAQAREAFGRHNGTPQYRRELSDYMARNMPPGQYSNRRIYDALKRQYDNEWQETLFHDLARMEGHGGRPNINLSNISAPLRGLGGFGIGSALGHNPLPWILASLAAGPISRAGQKAIDSVIDNPRVIRYVNNELMGPTGSRVLHGAATGTIQEGMDSGRPTQLMPYESILRQLGVSNAPQR